MNIKNKNRSLFCLFVYIMLPIDASAADYVSEWTLADKQLCRTNTTGLGQHSISSSWKRNELHEINFKYTGKKKQFQKKRKYSQSPLRRHQSPGTATECHHRQMPSVCQMNTTIWLWLVSPSHYQPTKIHGLNVQSADMVDSVTRNKNRCHLFF